MMWRPGDLLVTVLVLAMIAGLGIGIYSNTGVSRVEVVQGDASVRRYPAWQTTAIRVDGPLGETRIEIDDGAARIVASPCQQKICINRGWLRRSGETAACLPNRVSVTLRGSDARFDAMNF